MSKPSQLLVVLLDLNPFVWGSKHHGNSSLKENNVGLTSEIDLSTTLDHLLFFLKAYLLMSNNNEVCIIGFGAKHVKFIYPPNQLFETSAKSFKELGQLDSFLLKGISSPEFVNDDLNLEVENTRLSAALSLALCYTNKQMKLKYDLLPRILVMTASEDIPSQYIPFMNCIFSAQKKSIPIDACVLGHANSPFLQQSAHMTSGLYVSIPYENGLLQYLLALYLNDVETRKILNMPRIERVDFRASCFCHKTPLDVGYICSVCLSIFCKFTMICSTCKVRYPLPPKPVKPSKKTPLPISPDPKKAKIEFE